MKALVLELKENRAAVLDDCGIVHAIADKGYAIGQVLNLTEFELKREEKGAGRKGASANGSAKTRTLAKAVNELSMFTRVAAAILAVVIVGGGVTAYAAPVSTVTVEGATSVEYKLNIFDRVVEVSIPDEAVDVDGSALTREVKGMKIADAIDATAVSYGDKLFDTGEGEEATELTVKVDGLRQSDTGLSDKLDKKVVEIKNKTPENKKSGSQSDSLTATEAATQTANAGEVKTDYSCNDSDSDDSDHDSDNESHDEGAANTAKSTAKTKKKTPSAKSEETAPTEQSGQESGSGEAKPADPKPEAGTGAEQKSTEPQSAEQPKAEEKPAEQKHEEQKPADKKPAEEKPKEEKHEEPGSGETDPKTPGEAPEEKPADHPGEGGNTEDPGQANENPGEGQKIEDGEGKGEGQSEEGEAVQEEGSASETTAENVEAEMHDEGSGQAEDVTAPEGETIEEQEE